MKLPLTIEPQQSYFKIFSKNRFEISINHQQTIKLQESIVEKYREFVRIQKDSRKKNLLLTGGMLSLITGLPYIEQDHIIFQYKEKKVSFVNDNDNCKYFLGDKSLSDISGRHLKRTLPRNIPKLNKLISYVRTLKYNNKLSNIFTNSKLSFTVNPLIIEFLKKKDIGVKYIFPQQYLQGIRYKHRDRMLDEYKELSEDYYNFVFSKYISNSSLKILLLDDIENYFFYSDLQFNHLEKKEVPKEIYSGTGGMFTNRVIGLWAKENGSKVIRFAHGASSCFFNESDAPSWIIELAPTSDFIFPTKKFCDFVIKSRRWNTKKFGVKFDYGNGNKDLLISDSKPSINKPRVLYVGGLLRNNTQVLSPNIIDLVYFDWQFSLLRVLEDLKFDFESIIHPQSNIPRALNPINSFDANINFEDILDQFDVLIFDYFKSTTFVKSLCSNKKIIFIDVGGNSMNTFFKDKVKERCIYIDPHIDKFNRIRVGKNFLRDAILSREDFDRNFFKELYCG